MNLFYADSTYHNPTLNIANRVKHDKVKALTDPFVLSKETILKIKAIFEEELDTGLECPEKVTKKSSLQMEVTYVTKLPDGKEHGDFLSIDIGSTNFRVLLSRLNPSGDSEFAVQYYDVPAAIRTGASVHLFDHLAACIADFVSNHPEIIDKRIPLGFTFSYPCHQKAIDQAYLVTWTKSYDLPDAVGKNAVTLLREAIGRRGDLKADVVAILNDTTGTLVMGGYLDPKCAVAVILGSGFNICFVEKVARIKKLTSEESDKLAGSEEVAVDIECGAFGDNGCIDFMKTDVDREIDNESLFVNSFSFEKLFSGNFLGDVTRRLFLKLTRAGLLFDGVVMSGLTTKDSFAAGNAVQIEEAKSDLEVKEVLKVIGYDKGDVSSDDVAIVKYVVQLVANRGAVLASILLSALIERINRPEVTVAFDGSLYKHHPRIKKLLVDYITALAPGRQFSLILAEDGSGKGSGLVAAVVDKQRTSN
ncbi:Hexokinase HKDC1 [Halotydeus destructor]|nr:Hexokinase HKDC1 [Halotydeus destructor]